MKGRNDYKMKKEENLLSKSNKDYYIDLIKANKIDRLQEALKSSNEELIFLNSIIISANEVESSDDLYTKISDLTLKHFSFAICGIYMIDWEKRVANLVYHKNLTQEIFKRYYKIDIDNEPWKSIQKRKLVIHDNYIAKEGGEKINIPVTTGITVPFLHKDNLIGFMNLASHEKVYISDLNIKSLTSMGRNIGSTIRRVLLEEELRNTNSLLEKQLSNKIKYERELKENHDHYLSILNTIVDPLLVIDENLVIVLHNKALKDWNKLIKVTCDIEGKKITNIYAKNFNIVLNQIKEIFRDNIPTLNITEFKLKINNNEIILEFRKIPILRNEKVHQVILVLRNITARKNSENTLKQSEEKFSVLFHFSPLAKLLFRYSDSKLIDINETAIKMLGYDKNELLNRSADELNITKINLKYIGAELLSKHGKYRNIQSQIVTKGGKSLVGSFSGELIEIGGNFFILNVIEDITQRIKQEIQINKNNRLAALGQLSAGVAHQLNTPLANIILTTDYIKKSIETTNSIIKGENILLELDDIKQQVEYCSNIIYKLLLFSRKLTFSKMNVNIKEILEELLAFPAIESNLYNNNITINIDLKDNLIVEGDKTLLIQVFQNILENAIDSLRYKSIKIEERAKQNRNIIISNTITKKDLIISITDNGTGIDEDTMTKLFEPFFTTKDVGKGSGLGLPICKGIIEEHYGRINIESKLDLGTNVHVILPKA